MERIRKGSIEEQILNITPLDFESIKPDISMVAIMMDNDLKLRVIEHLRQGGASKQTVEYVLEGISSLASPIFDDNNNATGIRFTVRTFTRGLVSKDARTQKLGKVRGLDGDENELKREALGRLFAIPDDFQYPKTQVDSRKFDIGVIVTTEI